MRRTLVRATLLSGITAFGLSSHARCDEPAHSAANGDIAQELQNPVADLMSFPLQSNFDFGMGQKDAFRYLLNVQPVIPISLSKQWMLLSRTILPVVHLEEPAPAVGAPTGLSRSSPGSASWFPSVRYPSTSL
jgi:hypothetical protein